MATPSCSSVPTDCVSSDTADTTRICILHVDQQEKQKQAEILFFKPEQWTSVTEAASRRKQMKNFDKSKYNRVVHSLPAEPGCEHGYHVFCYKNFTAVSQRNAGTTSTEGTPSSKHLRSAAEFSLEPGSTSGIFPKKCLFCNKARKKKGISEENLGACETKQAEATIKTAARVKKDNRLLAVISSVDFVAKEVRYHHSCKSAYIKLPKQMSKDSNSKTQHGLEDIYSYVERSVTFNKRPELLTSVYAQYVEMCEDVGEIPITTAQNLLRNISNKFGKSLRVQGQSVKKMGSILYAEGVAEEALLAAYDYVSSAEARIRKAALELRKVIKDVKRDPLVDPPTLQNLRSGEASPPDLLLSFYRNLYGGPNAKLYSPKMERRATSSSQDALYIVQNGHVKPGKHIILGMAIKSMTGSKKIVQMLNRFGHIIDYSTIEELETSLGEAIQNKQQACPEGTIDQMVMGLAFDNFDEMTETLSGEGTLHDTMGILYQNKVDPSQAVGTSAKRSRKRRLEVHEHSLEPYRKKPRMTTFEYVIKTTNGSRPDERPQARKKDLAWMICHALGMSNIPMWVGFNSLTEPDNSTEQVVLYMRNLNQPITNLDVIQETLITTQKCARECGQQYGVVTYDLNASKPAMQIQVTESPRYDDLFVMLGPFHVEMAFFKAIGKLIDESGGPRILTDCDVLAPGSLNGLITGKHFNRCKRIHPILALAFEILHFQAFLETLDGKEELADLMCSFETAPDDERTPDTDTWQAVESSEIFTSCVTKYEEYTNETRIGKHGATAQFWITYVDCIHDYHNLERAIRTNDIDLFTHALTPIIQLFFATNHINYSRWLSKFQLDLINMDNTHPGLRSLLRNGAFTVKRTGKSFSRCPVDLTLEQTVNADAASRRTGLSSATNNYSTRLRWMITKSARAAVIAAVQEMAGMSNCEDTTAELHRSRIKRDTSDLQKVMEQIKGCCDPFLKSCEASPSLFNIRTGKVTSAPIKECLLGLRQKGKERHEEFIKLCFEDPNNFERSIKKERLLTFKENCKASKQSKDKRIASLVCSRDLLGRLLVLACKKDLDLKHVLSYPLTTVPLSMCSTDGMMVKTDRSALLHLLEGRVERSSPTSVDATIIDGNFFLRTLSSHLPGTYGGLAAGILEKVTAMSGHRVDIVFDAYPIPSIKESERARRGLGEKEKREYVIVGADQKRPKNIGDCLQSRSFKEELPKFLAEEWVACDYVRLINCKHLYLSYLGACFHFYVQGDIVVREVVEDLKTNHEEADTLICAHIKSMDDGTVHNVVVRASDTDIAVILVHHSWNIQANVWMDVGTSGRNDRRYINITDIGKTIGKKLSAALPAFHSFTGSDYTSAFVRKGKVRPFKQLEKDTDAQTAFAEMAKGNLAEKTTQAVMSFTAGMYGAKSRGTALSLDAHRHHVFEKSFGPKSTSKDPLKKLRGIDASFIPPCETEILQHIRRASFVARMWASADITDIQQHPTEDDGWELHGESYEISWFSGPQLPDTLVPDEEATDEEADEDFQLSSSDEEEDLLSSDANVESDDNSF